MIKKRILWWLFPLFIVIIILLFSIEESRLFIFALLLRIFIFVKKNMLLFLATFFLVKGKFILMIFLKKIALLSATGLGKRYLIEKVVMGNLKTHFLNHISDDIQRLIQYAKKNFKNFTLVKKIITIFAFFGSLGFVGKFMGGMLAFKVFIAKIWSFLLALFLKVSASVIYFFTDYLWGSWIAPIVEVVIFSWLLSWMEKVPFLAKRLRKIYIFFIDTFGWMENYMEKILHVPLRRFLKMMVKKIVKIIQDFIGHKHVSLWKRVQEERELHPNSYKKLLEKRKKRRVKKNEKNKYLSSRERLLKKRKAKSQ